MSDRMLDQVKVVALDLDGTLVDTAPDLAGAVNKMLNSLGLSTLPIAEVVQMVGDGTEMLVRRAVTKSLGHPPSADVFELAMDQFNAKYATQVFAESRVYPGVPETLRALSSSGHFLAVITNKPIRFSIPLLNRAGLAEYFGRFLCATSSLDRKPSPAMIQDLCRHLGLRASELLLVGDSRQDIEAARAAGCRVVGATYGYGAEDVIRGCEPDGVITAITELTELKMQATS
jgi:phosphoglycolate phosphatase